MNFEKIVYNHKDEIVKTFQELLQIPSVLDESDASVGAPFGNNIRKALEYMLSLEYAMPYQLLKTKNNRRKIIYIMTPVLFLLSIGCYFVKSYPMFYVEMGISIIALIWIIWFQSKGKKFENNVHEFVWNKSRYNKVEIDVQGIKLEDKKICELKEIDRVFLYKGFFFLITNEKKLLVLKTVGVETEELIKIIKEADILFEKREEPFNIYEYCKK